MPNKMFLLLKSLLSTISFMYLTSLGNNSIYVLFIFSILFFIYQKIETDKNLYTKLCASVFGVFSVLHLFQVNIYEDQLGGLPQNLLFIKLTLVFCGVYFFAEKMLSLIYEKLDRGNLMNKNYKLKPTIFFAICLTVLILLYLPIWIYEYPSNLNPDNISQIKQLLHGRYINHHPFAHTMWLKLLMSFGNDLNTRIGVAALLQLILNALTFSLISTVIYTKTKNIVLGLLSLSFFGILSFNAYLSITLIKDVTHATTTCLLLILLIEYFDCSNKRTKNIISCLLIIVSVGFCLFRTNGYFAFALMVFVELVYSLISKKHKLLLILLTAFAITTVIKGPLYTSLGVGKASYVESLSVPIQQIGLLKKQGVSFTYEQNELLNKIVNIDEIGEKYEVFLSDPIKNTINDFGNVSYLEEHKLEYLKLWIKIGTKYPIVYVRAWVDQVSTFFSPKYYGTSLFWGISNNNLDVVGRPLLERNDFIKNLYELAITQHNIPILGWFHYPAISTWVLCVGFFYMLRNKRISSAFLFTPAIGLFLTLLISCPYNICFRYYYAVVCSVPLLCMQSIRKVDY